MNNKLSIISILKKRETPRVLTTAMLNGLIIYAGVNISIAEFYRFVNDMISCRFLFRVKKGLYLNQLADPPSVSDEAAPFLCSGAIISLQRVLGIWGITNNPSLIVTAVAPVTPGISNPSLGQIKNNAGRFWFHGIASRVLFAGNEKDRIEQHGRPMPGRMPVATPEKALLDWIYLAGSRHSAISAPSPADMDMKMINLNRLFRLAKASGIEKNVKIWLDNSSILLEKKYCHEAEIGMGF